MHYFNIRHNSFLNNRMQNSPAFLLFIVSFAAFVVYTGMYGFRKPFTVGLYANWTFLGISYKVCLVIAQVLGYMISKLIGITIIASINRKISIQVMLICILTKWAA